MVNLSGLQKQLSMIISLKRQEFSWTNWRCKFPTFMNSKRNNDATIHVTVIDLRYAILICILKVILISYLFYNNFLVTILFIPYVYINLKNARKDMILIKQRQLCSQFKDGMLAVSFALNVGYSIENSFSEALSELIMLYGNDSLIVNEFHHIIRRIKRNENLELIMDEFAKRSECEDILYFAQVFHYAKRSGGDLISIIKNTAATISQKIEVEKEIQTIISGKKMEQRVMEYIPFAIILYLKVSSPEFIDPLYGNVTGVIAMTICVFIYFAASYFAKRIVNIEV